MSSSHISETLIDTDSQYTEYIHTSVVNTDSQHMCKSILKYLMCKEC